MIISRSILRKKMLCCILGSGNNGTGVGKNSGEYYERK
jgi:hypothetical protein